MIFISAGKQDNNAPVWLSAGQTIEEALPELIKHRIEIGEHVIIGGDCYIEDGVTIGKNNIIGKGSRLSEHSVLEDGVIIASDVFIGKHCVIKSRTMISRGSKIGEFSVIGSSTYIDDGVSLPPHSIAINRKTIEKSEKITAIISGNKKIESFFGSDEIYVFETNPNPDIDSEMTFSEFLKEAHITKLSEVLEKREKELKTIEISKLLAVLQRLILKN